MGNSRFKFRVWENNTRNCYLKDEKTAIIGDGDLIYGDMITNAMQLAYGEDNPNIIVEQSTGLRDKNGNLIYENDRVGFYVYGQDKEWHAQQGTVIWYNSCWGIETSSRFIQFENELTIKNPKDIEIIGNIHKQAE